MTATHPVIALALAASLAGCTPARARPEPSHDATVTSEDLRNTNEPMEVVLQRRVPGLVVRRTSAGLSLSIRGATDFNGNGAPPLYVLDGLPIAAGPGNTVPGLNIDDIATVKVLKGADTAVYGIDGANGVIVITTKQGGRRKP